MSTFAVTREVIGGIHPIKGADRIVRATLQGMDFQFVVGKGDFQIGDPVIYIPVDSILPDVWIEALNLKGKLAGTLQNRVKTITLRGVYSQGIVMNANRIPSDVEDITSYMGITKWDPPPNEVKDAILYPLPDLLSVYDIESSDRYRDLTEALMDVSVTITEKVEGENTWVMADPDGTLTVGMRQNTIIPKEGYQNHFYLASQPAHAFVREMARNLKQTVTVYGESLGTGSNVGDYYNLGKKDFRIFDMKIGRNWVDAATFREYVITYFGNTNIMVPILGWNVTLRTWLNGQTVKEASNGASALNPKLRREGIVIRPMVESKDPNIGRMILKQRSPAYLANTNL